MGATWFVYADSDVREALAVADACNDAIAAWLDHHQDPEEVVVAELGGGGGVPSVHEVVEAHRRYRLEVPDGTLERLARCRASIALDHPAEFHESPLSVSIARFVLARTGPSLWMFNDYPLVPSEQVQGLLRRHPGAKGFGEAQAPPGPRRPARRRAARTGELRAIRVHATLRRALEDPELGLDVRAAIEVAPDLARRYAALLLDGGAIDDVRAAKALGVEGAALTTVAAALDRALAALDEP